MTLPHDRRGTGEPYVLLHGLGADRRVWEPVLDRLAAGHDVIAVDLPGFGEAPPHPDPRPTPAVLARSVAGLLDELGLADAHVAGNSLGGWVALELAGLGRARSVAALAPAGLWGTRQPAFSSRSIRASRRAVRALRPIAPALVRSATGRRLAFGQMQAHPERLTPEAALHAVHAFANAPGFDATFAAVARIGYRPSGPIHVPVTIAFPEHDRLLLARRAQRAHQAPPGARIVGLHGCGHVPMGDDPDQVVEVLRRATS